MKKTKKADIAIKKAKKETREAEEATDNAQKEVVEIAELSRGTKKKKLTGAARDLEKAVHSAADSCEATEEAEFKVKQSKKGN